jgi:broad specificity phosphatase PhoE
LADIIIVRHGDTAWNRTERFRGMIDIDLDETGRQQAALTAKRIAALPVTAVYSSPVGRALETARIIAAPLDLEVQKLPDARDISFGQLEGLTLNEARQRYDQVVSRWLFAPDEVTFPGGESLGRVRERASRALEKIIKPLTGETVVIVSHKVVIVELIIHFLGLKDSQFRQIAQDTCAMNVFQKQKDMIYAILLNDTCHLDGFRTGGSI